MGRKIALALAVCAPVIAHAVERVEGGGLAAWVDNESIVLERGAVIGKVPRALVGLTHLRVVPARADGSDPLLFVSDDSSARLLRLDDAGKVTTVWGDVGTSSMGLGIGTRTRSAWLLDVDGDGTNEIVVYAMTHTDVGTQSEGAEVWRWDPARRGYAPRERRAKGPRPPAQRGGSHRTIMQLIAAQLKDSPAHVDRWGALDLLGGAERAFGKPREGGLGIGGGGASLLVGSTMAILVYRFLDRRQPAPRAEAHLAVVRVFPKVELLEMAALGTVGWPPNDCRFEGAQAIARDAATGAIVVGWPRDASSWVTRAIPFDGKQLGAPGPIIEHSRCKK